MTDQLITRMFRGKMLREKARRGPRARRLLIEALEDRRLLAAGSLDPTFDGDGQVISDLAWPDDQTYGVAVQADGKIVAAGYATGLLGDAFAAARYQGDAAEEGGVFVDGSGNLVVTDADGGATDDLLTLRRVNIDGTDYVQVGDPFNELTAGAGATQVDAHTVRVPLAAVTGRIQVNALGGNDSLRVDASAAIGRAVVYDGGAGGDDALTLSGGRFGTVVHKFTGAGAGTVDLDNDGTPDLSYTGLEPFLMTSGTADLVLDVTSAGITDAVLRDYTGGGDAGHSELAFTAHSGEDFQFQPPGNSLKIITHGNSTVNVSGFDAAFNTPNLVFEDTSGLSSRFALAAGNVIPDAVSLTVTGDAVFDLNGREETVNGLSGTGTIDNTAAVTPWLTVGAGGASSTFSGVIRQTVGGVSLKKTGTGTLRLSGAGSNVTELQVFGNGTLNVTGGLNSSSHTIIGLGTGGTLNWSGTGTLGSGAGWVGGGENSGAVGTINVTGGSLTLSAGPAEGFYLGHNGSGALNVSGGTVTINSNHRPLYLGGVPGYAMTRATSGTVTVSGTGVVNIAGTGTFLLGADNALAGGTVNLDGGTLRTGRSLTKGTGAATVNFNGGTLQAAGDNPVWLQGLSAAHVKNGGAVIDTQGFTVGILQPLLNSGTGGLTKLGSGVLDLAKPGTYAGETSVLEGTLRLQPPVAGSAVWLDADDVNADSAENNPAGGTKIGSGTHPWVNKGTLGIGDGVQGTVSYQPALLSGGLNGRDALTFLPLAETEPQYLQFTDTDLNGLVNNAHTIFVVARAAAGAGPDGAQGLAIFPGQHSGLTFDGNDAADTADSHQWIGGSDALSTYPYTQGTVAVLTSVVTGSSASGPSSNQLFVNGSAGPLQNRASALKTYTNGLLRIGGANPSGSGWEWGLTGQIAEVVIYGRALGVAEREEVEAYLGYKWRDAGAAYQVLPAATAVTVANGATLDLNGIDQTVGSLSGVAGSAVTLGAGTLTTLSTGSTEFAGVIRGSGGLVKQGDGTTFTLSGINTYTGETTVGAGTLALSGATNNNLSSSPNLILVAGAVLDATGLAAGQLNLVGGQTLQGTGTVTGKLQEAAGSTLSPGTSPGIIVSSSDLTLAGATLFDVAGSGAAGAADGYDQVQVSSGAVAISGTATITYTGAPGAFDPSLSQVFTLIDNQHASATTTGAFANHAEGDVVTLDGKRLRLSYQGGDGNDVVLLANFWPTDISLAPSSVAENQPVGTVVGDLSTADLNLPGDGHTYTLVSGTGAADNGEFTIAGSQLKTNAVFDYETKNSYSIRVRTTDQGGLWYEEPLVVTVIDVDEIPPAVMGTTPSFAVSGTVNAGSTSLAIAFSEAVVGGDNAGNYQLQSLGADSLLGTADDAIVPLAASYSGTTATLTFGPLAQSVYRLRVHDAISDPTGNSLDGDGDGSPGGDWVRDFVAVPGGVLFSTPPSTFGSEGTGAASVAGGDFNGDGTLDLAVANYGTNQVGVLLGDGAGGFGGAVKFGSGGNGPISVIVGHFNADAHLDLAVANSANHKVGILLGDGAGGFVTGATSSTGLSGPESVTAGDFNGDGKLDLAVANYNNHTVGVLLGNGDGEFAAATTFASGGGFPRSVAAGDFNGDGNLDIAVANSNSQNVGVLRGNGAGGFAAVATFWSGGQSPVSVTVGDFNADGRLDLAVTNSDSQNVGVLLGNGVGGFAGAVTFGSGGSSPRSVTGGDFDADGRLDLTLVNASNSTAGVLLGNGTGGFASAVTFATGGSSPSSVTVGDFNGDGNQDLAVANWQSKNVGILLSAASVRRFDSPQPIRFGVQTRGFGAGQLVEATGNAFDGAVRLEVAGQTYAPASAVHVVTDGGRTVVTPAVTMAELQVSREITVPDAGSEDFARTLDVFHNPTGSAITTTVRIVGNLGSDGATTVFETSDGDTALEPTDQWIGTDDADGSGAPAIVHYVHGPGDSLHPASVVRTEDNIEWTYTVTVPAGQTVRLMHFTILAGLRAGAVAAAGVLVTPLGFGAQAAAYLTQDELYSILNFDAIPPAVTVAGLITNDVTPAIRGTVSDGTLQVTVHGKTYTTGDGNLTVNGTAWTLQIPAGDALPLGTYDVTATATDEAGNVGSDSTTDELQIVKLIVTSLTATRSGFVAQFSGEFKLDGLNLYDGAGGVLGAADVILTDGAGQTVAGSMVVADNRQAMEFVATGGVLAPDTFTVTLKSGAAALRALDDDPLDGNRDGTPGDDFTGQFTVAPSADRIVSIPDFARGAGQAVNVPNAAAGLPIRIGNAESVTSLSVEVVYRSSLLQITAAALAAGVPGDWTVDPLSTRSEGAMRLTAVTAHGTTPLSGTDVEVVRMTAAVPDAAPYGASQVIRLENVVLNGGTLAASGDVAVHKAAYLGDADGSGIHSSADAFLTVQAALGLASGFAAHPWTDPRIVGDADGSGVLSAADAFLIVQEGLGLSEPFVPDNPQIGVTPVGGGVDPQFQIDLNLPASAGGLVTVPVRLAIEPAATNVGAIDFDLFFDPAQLTIQVPAGVSAGADTAGWAVSATLVAPGQLRVGLVSSRGRALAPGQRDIARLQFRVEAEESSRTGWQPVPEGLPTLPTLLTPITDHRLPITDVLDGSETHPTWLDIEPVDPRSGGYTWTASDGSIVIRSPVSHDGAKPWDLNGDRVADVAGVRNGHQRYLQLELDPLEPVLADFAGDIASAWRLP